jgi:hypothetical protein
MSDWQPARVRFAHGHELSNEDAEKILKSVIHVQPVDVGDVHIHALSDYRKKGCDSTKFYTVRDRPIDESPLCFACEHEILTD